MKAGGEFLFWLILFAEILGCCAVYGLLCLILKYRAAIRQVAGLTVERNRYRAWLYYKSTSRPVMNPPAQAEARNRVTRLRAIPTQRSRAEEYRGTVTVSEARPVSATAHQP